MLKTINLARMLLVSAIYAGAAVVADWQALPDKAALTAQQQRSMQAFAETGCTSCHSGVVDYYG